MFNSFPQPKPDGGGRNIKSIQRGVTTLFNVASTTQAISTVDPLKSIVKITLRSNGATINSEVAVRADITNGTTLTFTRESSSANAVEVSWEVIEYVSVKSLQKGSLNVAAASGTITITSINLNNSILYFSHSTSDTTSSVIAYLTDGVLTNSTTITFNQNSASGRTINWQVIEFP